MTMRRAGQLVVSCVVLGIGVAGLLLAALGSDGYSTLVNGVSLATGAPFLLVNAVVGVVLIGLAAVRGTRPGLGTVVQPLLVGAVVSGILATVDQPQQLWVRIALLVLSLPVLAVGVAGYLGSGTGAGPAEAAALAWDPPLRFRWSYSAVQAGGALIGWLLGAAIGPGTLLVILLLGPMADALANWLPGFDVHAGRTPVPEPAPEACPPA